MQLSPIFKPAIISVFPPLYQWPQLLKRVVLAVATIFCFAIYTLLGAGLVSLLALAINVLAS